jgi:hypothetical protein
MPAIGRHHFHLLPAPRAIAGRIACASVNIPSMLTEKKRPNTFPSETHGVPRTEMKDESRIKRLIRSVAGVSVSSPRLSDVNSEQILQKALDLFRPTEIENHQTLVAKKIEDLQHYDVFNMQRAVAVCHWGRSGSLFAASYLDGHDDVVLLPPICGDVLYEFFERYPSLTLRDKLTAYPLFSYQSFFEGEFAIDPTDYYTAVAAISEVYKHWSPSLLETSRAFFQCLHVAFSLALGRRPASPCPLMVWQLHWWNEKYAQWFIDDFPKGLFLHTVRDPIAAYDRTFGQFGKTETHYPSWWTIRYLNKADKPHPGTERMSRAVRFEDLHNRTAETVSRIAEWLGLPYQPALMTSTFNGIPYVVERGGITWSGARPQQAERSSANLCRIDRLILFALFHEDFVAWQYSYPGLFKNPLVRTLACIPAFIIPMKPEIIVARRIIKHDVVPALRQRNFRAALKGSKEILLGRLMVVYTVASELGRRMFLGKDILKLI